MGELDFRDMYWQLCFNTESPQDKKKLSYLCIRTAFGTMTYSRAAMGLIGMDALQEELTDKLLGDLVVEGKVFKQADNIYFGADNLEQFQKIFEEIIKRCHLADLRIKPSKIRLNIKSADILGLHWNQGTLTGSPHKLDPLAHCDRPKTIKGL